MRLFSWTGCAALAAAAAVGYGTNEAVHRCQRICPAMSFVGQPEESDTAALAAPNLLPPLPTEEIDLTCLPVRIADDLYRHTPEPPLAGAPGAIRAVGFDVPAPAEGPEVPPAPAVIPFLTDDEPAAPAKLPMMEDEAAAPATDYPVRQCTTPSGPIWEVVKQFFMDAASPSRFSAPKDVDQIRDIHGRPKFRSDLDVGGLNYGMPPIGEFRPTPEVGGQCPCCPGKPKCCQPATPSPMTDVPAPPPQNPKAPVNAPTGPRADTMECRPGEGWPPPTGATD